MSALLKMVEPVSWEAYEAGEEGSEIRHEFVNGQVFAMAGGSKNHNRISLNIAGELRRALKGQPCEAFMADVKLKLMRAKDLRGYYPDVLVACEANDGTSLHSEKPQVIVEVTSPSTARTDHEEKRLAYQSIDSLEEYVIVEQFEKKAVHFRRSAGWKALIAEGEDAYLIFESLKIEIPFGDVYDRVDWSLKESPEI